MKVIMVSGKAENGKSSLAEALVKEAELNSEKALIVSIDKPMKYVAKEFFGWDGDKDEWGRDLLIHLGSDWVCPTYPEFWAEFAVKLLTAFRENSVPIADWDWIIVDDARREMEINLFKKSGFDVIVVRVERHGHENKLTPEQRAHASETGLDDYDFDYIVANNAGLEQLGYAAETLFEEIKSAARKSGETPRD